MNKITQGSITKQLLLFFFPIMLGTFFQQLYNTADAMIVGNFVGTEALAAVGGSTSSIINLTLGFFVGLSSGATVIISQFIGKNDASHVNKAVHTAIALAIVSGTILMVGGFILAPSILKAMNTQADILPYATTYLQIFFLGMIFNMIYNLGSGILRAVGDAKRPLYYLIVACIVNIILDIVFVIIFKWNVAGVAIATIISQMVSAILVIYTLMNKDTIYQLKPRNIKFHGDLLVKIIKIGLPAGIQSVTFALSNVIIQARVNEFDTDYVAAWTAYSKIDGFFWLIIGAFGIAITTFVGQNYGAGRLDRVRKSISVCLILSLIATLIIIVSFNYYGATIYGLFTQNTNVIAYGMEILAFLTPYFIAFVFIEILAGGLRGVGDTLIPTILTTVGICAFRIIWINVINPFNPNFTQVITCYPISWVITALAFIVYYYSNLWDKKRVATTLLNSKY